MTYVDSSVLLRIILKQPERLASFNKIASAATSSITRVECLRSIERHRMGGRLDEAGVVSARASALALIDSMSIIELSGGILELAASPHPVSLSTLDAIHVASALSLGSLHEEKLSVATHDRAMAQCFRAYGLEVLGQA